MVRLLIILWSFSLAPALSDTLPHGVVIDTVQASFGTPYSYALYIPSRYDTTRQWPVIFGLDPIRRGYKPVTVFAHAAEKYGYILAGSNDSQNGPVSKVLPAIRDMMLDVLKRFRVDPHRIYFTGFSGGSRVSSYLALHNSHITGIIACGAGLISGYQLSGKLPFSYVSTVGNTDMNYYEMNKLHRSMDEYGIQNHEIIFNGSHQWPDSLSALQAVQWLQLDAVRRKLIRTDTVFISNYVAEQVKLALDHHQKGDAYLAYHILSGVRKDAGAFPFVNTHAIDEWLHTIERSRSYRKQRRETQRIEHTEYEHMVRYLDALHTILNVRFDQTYNLQSQDWWQTQVREINRMKRSKSIQKQRLGKRLEQFISANVYEYHRMIEQNWHDYHRLVWMDEVGVVLYPKSPVARYLLARSLILDKQTEPGLKTLQEAVRLGYNNFNNLKTNPDFESVRNKPVFQQLLEQEGKE